MPRPTFSFWLWSLLAVLIMLTTARSALRYGLSQPNPQKDLMTPEGHVIILPLISDSTTHKTGKKIISNVTVDRSPIVDTLGTGDSIYLSLKRHGVSNLQLVLLSNALSNFFDASKAKPGDKYELVLDQDRNIVSFAYSQRNYPERVFNVNQTKTGFAAQQIIESLDTVVVAFEVMIEGNVSTAIHKVGESDLLTDIVTDVIFGSVIDFQKDPRYGDRLGIVLQKLYKDEIFVRDGRVLVARYDGKVVSQTAVFYEDGQKFGYYDENGKSVERMFLLSPLSYRRISSGFTHKRFHPILKRNIPHLGIDFAAPTGTKVWATARGTVTHASRKGGYGKLVEIEHPNGYRTRYAHLNQISVSRGQHVNKYDTIGRVGATGRATGPHLHYELLRNGHHQNPTRINKSMRGDPLPKEHLSSFYAHKNRLLEKIDDPRFKRVASGHSRLRD